MKRQEEFRAAFADAGKALLHQRESAGDDTMFITVSENATLRATRIVTVLEQGRDGQQSFPWIAGVKPHVGHCCVELRNVFAQRLAVEPDVVHAWSHD